MVPEGWELNKLEDLADKQRPAVKAGPFGSALKKEFYEKTGYKVYGQEQVISNDPFHGNYYISEEKFRSLQSCKVEPGDILISLVGTIGKVLLLPANCESGIINPRLLRISTDLNRVAPTYLKYFLESETVARRLSSWAQGGTMGVLNAGMLKKLKVPLPPQLEQKKIAQILSTWDKAITTTEQLLANSQKQKKALMQQLLTGKKRLLDENGVRFCGEWRAYKFEELFNERIETKRDDLPLLSITSDNGVIYQNESGRKNTSNEDKSKYRRICINDIGYNTMRMWQGRSCLSDKEGIVSPAYTILIPSKHVIPAYAAYLFKLPRLVHVFYRHSQGLVSDTWNLKFSNFKKITWLFPRLDEQRKIAQLLRNADKEVSILVDKIDALRQEKKALMQQLLTGKRRVKVDEDAA